MHKPKLLFNIDEISAVSIFHDISFTPHSSPQTPLNYLLSISEYVTNLTLQIYYLHLSTLIVHPCSLGEGINVGEISFKYSSCSGDSPGPEPRYIL